VPDQGDVLVTGVVKDRDTNKPIAGVTVHVSRPGIMVDDYYDNDMPEEDTLTTATTDSQGKFRLKPWLARGQNYALIFTADGYRPGGDDWVFDDSPALLRVSLAKNKR
jgi:hypothetical protein